MSVGRPPWIPSKEELEKVESLAARGMTQQQIADCLDIHIATLMDKKKEYVELNEAIKRGKAKGIANVTAALLKNIQKGNATSQIFYLKCQAGWTEEATKMLNEMERKLQEVKDTVAKLKSDGYGRPDTITE